MEKTAKELGFKQIMKPMTKEQTNSFITIMLGEPRTNLPEEELPFTLKMLNKRLEVMDLPIKITERAKWLLFILTEQNPGKMNVALIDCLTEYSEGKVDYDEVVVVYKMGFYTDESVIDYGEIYIKPRLCRWSQIY